jgi:hypothetical protein
MHLESPMLFLLLPRPRSTNEESRTGARDMDVSPLVCFLLITVVLLLLNNNITEIRRPGRRRATIVTTDTMGEGRAAGARNPTRLEPLGIFLFYFFLFFIY